MLKKITKFFRNSAIILAVVSISFSNVPYYSLTKILDSYIAHQNIVDKSWHVSQNDNVVDKFTSYRHLVEKVRVYEAYAATLEYVGGAEASGNSAAYNMSLTSLVGGSGTAVQTGDLVIVATGFVSTSNRNPGVGTAGYTEVADLYASDTRDANLSISWKFMSGAPDTTVSCNGSLTATMGAVCVAHVWRNADPTTPLDVVSTTAIGTNSAIPNSPAITPTTPGAVVLTAGLGTGASADNAITAPTGYINQIDRSVDPSSASTVGLASRAWVSGTEDPAAWTAWTTSTQDSWNGITLAIRPRNDPPTLTVSQPDGTGDTVMAGDLYNVTYDLNDIEEPVTVAMYYDTDAVGLNGTAITGACAAANEGTGMTCSWDTTGVTPGTYYVYGLTSDGYNPQVSDYSPGMITIIPPPTITDYANTDEPALDYSPACTNCGARIGGGALWQHEVTLTGVTFGADPGAGSRSTATNNVTVGGHRIADANVTAWSNTSITFLTDSSVPGDTDTNWGAEFGGAGALTVTAGGVTSAGLNFNVFPQIFSITPPAGLLADQAREYDAGDTDGIITLIGTRFGSASGSGSIAGLSGDYYCGVNFNTYNSTNQDTTVNFDPADTILGDRACGPDNYSVRWSGYVRADFSETFTFYTMSDDGVRLSVNGNQIINNWTDHGPIEDSGTVALTAGVWVPIVLEFYEAGGGSTITLSYSSTSESKKIIPSTNLETIVLGSGSVTIVGQNATISSWGNEEIVAQVPTSITDTVNTGSVAVAQGAGGSSANTSTYAGTLRILPRITSFNPTNAAEGAGVTINGNHFCQAACPGAFDANNFVTYTSDKVVTGATTWTATSITTTVPINSVSGDVVVTSNNLTSNPQFFTVNSLRPNLPTNLNQWRNSGLTDAIPVGGPASSTPIYITMDVENTGNTGGTLYPQVEYKPIGTAFTCESPSSVCADAVDGPAAGAAPGPYDCSVVGNACAIAISPTDNVYHWQARARFNSGGQNYYGPWVSFDDANPEDATDFQFDSTPPGISSVSSGTPGTNDATITWTTDQSATGQAQFQAVPVSSCSSFTFNASCSVNNDCSAIDATLDLPQSRTLSNLNSGTEYCYRVRSKDAAGNEANSSNRSFVTSSDLSPAKTITSYIDGAVGMISSAVQYYFTANVPEVDASIQNAYVEVFGVVAGGTGTVSIQANGVASRAYDVTAAAPTLYRLLYQITSPSSEANLNLNDVAPCTNGELTGLPPEATPPCNSVTVTPSGVSMYVLSTKLITTYTYTP